MSSEYISAALDLDVTGLDHTRRLALTPGAAPERRGRTVALGRARGQDHVHPLPG